MKEFQDLVNKFLDGFTRGDEGFNTTIKGVEVNTDVDGIEYIAIETENSLPKLALDEIRELGYRVYGINTNSLVVEGDAIRVGFYKPEEVDDSE